MSSKTQLPHLLLQERELPEHPLAAAHEAEPRQRGGRRAARKAFQRPHASRTPAKLSDLAQKPRRKAGLGARLEHLLHEILTKPAENQGPFAPSRQVYASGHSVFPAPRLGPHIFNLLDSDSAQEAREEEAHDPPEEHHQEQQEGRVIRHVPAARKICLSKDGAQAEELL